MTEDSILICKLIGMVIGSIRLELETETAIVVYQNQFKISHYTVETLTSKAWLCFEFYFANNSVQNEKAPSTKEKITIQ